MVVLQLNRPESRNAISESLMDELANAVSHAGEPDPGTVLVLRGSGGWFASGGDLREFETFDGPRAGQMLERMRAVLNAVEEFSGPTVAVLDGPAIGGGAELALAFDLRVASSPAWLRYPEAHLGVTTGWQGAERLRRLVGYSHAADLLLTGRKVSSTEALGMGLVNRVWEPDEFEGELHALLRSLHRASLAGVETKRLLRAGLPELTGADVERRAFERLWDEPRRLNAMRSALRSGSQAALETPPETPDNEPFQ